MNDTIQEGKLVELKYLVVDKKTDAILRQVEYPISYLHGSNDILSPEVSAQLQGCTAGDTIEIPIDCNKLYGPRDESLVFTDRIENVPEEYREIGTTITMESESGKSRNFIVTKITDSTLTVDGNNPLCGRDVIFKLKILSVRDATDEEMEAGGAIGADPDINEILK
jgi:FKBP-type peptidyl-prolyl cis-trans isomerase SlyD